jgi:hypothetical protein
MPDEAPSTEERILIAMRSVLIDVIRDTTTDPRLKHPLADATLRGIRDCLDLITARQAELAEAAGRPMTDRPHFADEPRRRVSVPLTLLKQASAKKPPGDPEPGKS